VLAAQNQPLGGARGTGPEKAPDKNDKRAATRCREANKYPRRAANFEFCPVCFESKQAIL